MQEKGSQDLGFSYSSLIISALNKRAQSCPAPLQHCSPG